MEPKMIIFEGTNKSGKTTLKNLFAEKTQEKHICIDRGPLSNIVYNVMFKRNPSDIVHYIDYLEYLNSMSGTCIVHIHADIKTLLERNKEDDEDFVRMEQYLYHMFLDVLDVRHLRINTIKRSPEECVDELIQKIKDLDEGVDT